MSVAQTFKQVDENTEEKISISYEQYILYSVTLTSMRY